MNSIAVESVLEKHINVRYVKEADSCCSLSCGSALDHANVNQGEIVLDLGSGRGMDTIKAAKLAGENGKAIGLDFTEKMIDVSEVNRKKLNIANASFIKGNIESIPLEDKSVDVVISNCTINHSKDKKAVYSEIYRVLKKGGRFIVSDVIAETKLPDSVVNDPQAWADCYGGAIPMNEYFECIADAGFELLDILEESDAYEKGGVMVRSITIRSYKNKTSCCGCGCN